ncbi:MAG TPA: hypothetical protein PKE39_01245 [Ignavibacteria bacterium]|nr:hypothetical protein [Ignavibacteria bacterium]HMQ97622.1 hypothetical protein [Ignavibacteria bacterium]
MAKTTIVFWMYISAILYAQDYDTPEQQNREAVKSIEVINKILSTTDTSSYAPFEKTQPGLVDSICNLYKSVQDYEDEKVYRGFRGNTEELGNQLRYYHHSLGRLNVSYVTYKIFLFKISFDFTFTYAHVNGGSFFYSPEKEFIDSLIGHSKIPVQIFYSKYENEPYGFGCSFYFNSAKRQLLSYKKDMVLDIDFNIADKVLVNEVNSVNDPANLLEYGFACGIGGSPPEGLKIFAKLVHLKKMNIIEQLLFSANPVTRLMAVDAIEYYAGKNFYSPPEKILKKMEEVKNEQIVINTCWGCFYENLTMKEANVKAAEDKKHLYDNFRFFK